MSYKRFRMDLAVKEPIPAGLAGQLNAIRHHMVILQSFSEKINAGHPNEENTTWLEEHICYHDEGKKCGQPQDLRVSTKDLEESRKHDTMGELRVVARIPFTKWALARHK